MSCLSCLFLCLCVQFDIDVYGASSEFLESSISKPLLIGVHRCSSLWDEYAGLHIRSGDKYLNNVPVGSGAQHVVCFIQYLLNEHKMTVAAVRHNLTCLHTVFIVNFGNVAIFESSILTTARRALQLKNFSPDIMALEPTSPTVIASDRKLEQLPFTVDMLAAMRESYWVPGNITRRMVYIASATALYRGMRVSQVASTGKANYERGVIDHRYRIKDLVLHTANDVAMNVSTWLDAGRPSVDVLVLSCRSSKTHGPNHKTRKTMPPIVLYNSIGSFTEQQFFSDLLEWLPLSGSRLSEDLLFCRPQLKSPLETKMLMYNEVTKAIKDVADTFGFNVKQFNTRGFRIGANNELAAQKASDGERCANLGHASLKNNLIYFRASLQSDISTFAQDGALTAAKVYKMAKYN